MALLEVKEITAGYGEVQILWGSTMKSRERQAHLSGRWQWGRENDPAPYDHGIDAAVEWNGIL